MLIEHTTTIPNRLNFEQPIYVEHLLVTQDRQKLRKSLKIKRIKTQEVSNQYVQKYI